MGFSDIVKAEDVDFYLDLAFRKAKDAAKETRSGVKGTRVEKSKKVELARIEAINSVLFRHFEMIVKSFPSIDDLSEFYKELIKATINYKLLKKSLGAINWARIKTSDFTKIYQSKIKKCEDLQKVSDYRREYYGRMSSLVKQIGKELKFLANAKKTMAGFPSIKTKLPAVAVVGFPNVGKTTLLSKITKSKPEIAAYAFTTKGINVGYIDHNYNKIQVLDTPGTLNRFNKMNTIEKQASLAIKYVAEVLVYVFDLTESTPLSEQIKLFETFDQKDKKVIVYLSKTDILEKSVVEKFSKKYNVVTDVKSELIDHFFK